MNKSGPTVPTHSPPVAGGVRATSGTRAASTVKGRQASPPEQLALQFELPFLSSTDSSDESAPPIHRGRLIHLGNQVLDYALKRSRRKSIGFVIDEHGLSVSAPRWVTLAQIEDAIREKQRWILAKIAEFRAHRQAIPRVRWESGGTLPYLGEDIVLRVVTRVVTQAVTDKHARPDEAVSYDAVARLLHIALPPGAETQQIKDRAQAWLQTQARRIFAERLDLYAERLGVRYSAFRLSSAATRWGSCSAEGKILLNWRLVHFPLSSIDYVVAHELAHLREMNHGPRFWQTVADLLPGFESARDHLRNPPPELLPNL